MDAGASAAARRFVSLVPSTTETLFALGLGDRVVGVSTYCDYPAEATRLPRVGAMLNPSLEAIVALRPDALVGVEGPVNLAVLERLRARGVRTVFPRTESVPEVLDALAVFARLAGEPGRAGPLRVRIEAQLARVEAVVRGRARPRVLMVFSVRPLVVAGRGSWTDAVLTRAGGVNVATGDARYPTVSVEQVLAWAPEVVLDLSTMSTEAPPDGSLVAALTAHGTVPAVTAGRVHVLTDPRYVRPGPRVGEAAEGIARVLHPDAGW